MYLDSLTFQQAIIRRNRSTNDFSRALSKFKKNENIAEKRLISHGILHETIKYYICMERGKTREASGGDQN
jgi:hypothetical protein